MLTTVLLLLSSIALFAIDLLQAFCVTKKVAELDEERRVLLAKAAQLNRDAAKLTSPSTFAQCAKLQRTAIFNEKQAEKLSTQQVQAHWLQHSVPKMKVAVYMFLTVALWTRSAAHIDTADTWPLTRWLSGLRLSGYALHGDVAVAPYLAITQVVSYALVRVIVPQAWC
ncbi:hypothetical protein ABBQ38_014434 [Trebouxia sp. C0009 RCD-2024]